MGAHFLTSTYFSVLCDCTQMQYSKCHIVKIPAVRCLHTVDVPFPTVLMKAKRESPMNKWFDVAAHKYVKLEQSKSGGFPGYNCATWKKETCSVLISQKEIKLNHDWNGLSKCIYTHNNNVPTATCL